MNGLLMLFSNVEGRGYLPLRKRGVEAIVKHCFSIFLVIMGLTANDLVAEDSVSSLMHRMKSQTAVKISYQETRILELMEQPWQGSGYMYSMPPDLMIREQLQPQR